MRTSGAAPSPLIGKLFDERGEGLTPSHAVKGKRRYRYYVSRSLIKGCAGQATNGWRVPAAELERIVATATKTILDDRQLIIAAIEQAAIDSRQTASLLETAAALSAQLSAEAEASSAVAALVDRVELRPDGIRLALKLPASTDCAATDRPALTIMREIPMQIRRRGVERKLVIGDDRSASPKVDEALLKAVARAHCWFADLLARRATSMVELARRDGVAKQYVSRLLRLAFLAPEIVERIVDGCQPPELTAQSLLTSRVALPLDWAAQKQALGLAPRV